MRHSVARVSRHCRTVCFLTAEESMLADVDEEFIDKMADIVQRHLRVSKLNGFVSELLHRSYDVPCVPMCKAL